MNQQERLALCEQGAERPCMSITEESLDEMERLTGILKASGAPHVPITPDKFLEVLAALREARQLHSERRGDV